MTVLIQLGEIRLNPSGFGPILTEDFAFMEIICGWRVAIVIMDGEEPHVVQIRIGADMDISG